MANIMNIDVVEKDCNALNILFQTIINDMKNSPPIWEDFICKTTKLHTQLKSTICASTAFLESFQKIADLATNTKGITKDIGASLTRLCIRHKAIEAKFKQLTCSLNESLVQPLNDKLEEWKKTIINLDKEHNKEYKKVRGELKKKATDTMRLHKKLTKKQPQSGTQQSDQQSLSSNSSSSTTYYVKSSDLQYKYDTCLQETHNYYALLEETEKQHLRLAMIEQRNHFCTFFKLLKPIIDIEISMLNEANNMEEIIANLCKHTNDTTLQSNNINSSTQIYQLEQTIKDLKGSPDFLSTITQNNSNLNLNLNTNSPPSSPSSLGSRKSSVCSINSLTSSSSSSSHSRSPGHLKFRMQQQLICGGINRLSSVSSQDSGFTSQEQFYLKSPHLLDDKDSNEYKIAMACGTIKAWSKNAIANGANGVNGVMNGSNGSNSSLTQTSNQQITTVQQTGSSTIVDCSLLARHTVAGLPMPLNNDSQQSHKTRPALSIHTFDPPDHPTNGHLTTNGHHDQQQQQQQSPSVSSPVIRSNSVRIDPTNHQPPQQLQQHYESPSKLTTTNHQSSSPCNNNNNTNRVLSCNNQIPITTTTTTTILNNNNHQIMNNCNQNTKNRQRSTTLPPEAIAEGMKELMKTNKNILMNPSPSKQLYNTTNSTLSTLSGTGSSDTLLEEDASFECFNNNNNSSHQLHDNRHRYSVDRITIPSTNHNNFVYNEFNLSTTTSTTTATSLSSPSSSSTHSSTNSYNSVAFSSSNNFNSSIPVKTNKPQPPIRRNSSISSNSAAISQKNFIISQQQQHQIQLQYQQENNYDDLHHIQKYNKLLNEQKQQQQQQQQLATIPPSPPPPPPPPLPVNGFNNTTNKIQNDSNSTTNNNYDDLPPPPDSFYSDDTPYNHNNGYIIKQETTTVIKQQQQQQQQTQQPQQQQRPQNNNVVSVHQVLMSQIQFGVKLKPTNRPK